MEDSENNGGQIDGVTVSIGKAGRKKQNRDDFISEQLENHIAALNDLRGMDVVEVKGYVYRQTLGNARTALPPIEEFLDDEQIGLLYGPGVYQVAYRWTDESGQAKIKTVKYSIGREFAERHRKAAEDEGRECYLSSNTAIPGIPQHQTQPGGLFDLLNAEKIAAFSALVAAIKQMFPQNGSGDLKTVIEAQNKIIQAAIPSAAKSAQQTDLFGLLMPKMLERVFEPPKSEIGGLLQNLETFKSIKDMFENGKGEESEGGGMIGLVEKFLPMLPAFLEKFGGNERLAGAELKKNALVKFYLNNPAAQEAFYSSVSSTYGPERAARLAEGLGIPPRYQTAPQPIQATTAALKTGNIQF